MIVLDEPRHRCLCSGTCCQGLYVEVGDEARARIEDIAAQLGVDTPIVEGGVRFDNGQCVFLGDDLLCNIHREHGGEAKPLTCQQFPFVAIETETEHRAGIDPACSSAWRTWRNGPRLVPEQLHTRLRTLNPPEQHAERAIISAASQPGMTVAGLLHLICAGRPGSDLPPGFASRWVRRLVAADLPAFLDRPDTGHALRAHLGGVARAVEGLDPNAPPEWPVLDPEWDAFAVEVTRRMLFLRLAPLIPSVMGVALLTLGGTLACAWANADPEHFGPALAGWARAIRFRAVWQAITPDAETMRWLATGQPAS